jgi:UDP-2,3-diacylglucosamine pyrophosphatase LpxH
VEERIEERLGTALGKLEDKSYAKRFAEINKMDMNFMKKKAKIVDLKDCKEPITIIPISDIHLGSKDCNIAKLEKALSLIYEMPNCYTILLRDHTETATKTSVGLGVYDEEFGLKEQMKLVYKLMKPLAEKGKILGSLTGNHEMRIAYHAEVNPTELLAERLGIDYFDYQGYISIHLGNQIYHIFAHHGAGAGCSPAGKLNAMRALNKIAQADIYLSGHTHGRMYDHDVLMKINDTTGNVEPTIRYYVVCGSFLEYWGGYAEMKMLTPSTTGVVALTLNPEEKNISVIL